MFYFRPPGCFEKKMGDSRLSEIKIRAAHRWLKTTDVRFLLHAHASGNLPITTEFLKAKPKSGDLCIIKRKTARGKQFRFTSNDGIDWRRYDRNKKLIKDSNTGLVLKGCQFAKKLQCIYSKSRGLERRHYYYSGKGTQESKATELALIHYLGFPKSLDDKHEINSESESDDSLYLGSDGDEMRPEEQFRQGNPCEVHAKFPHYAAFCDIDTCSFLADPE